ncbi:MAG: hypothetical protein OEW18_02170 [Candidatus Aminicenantes bacterium]|nr:hypothetical protein [Candidatus Aminicenantes bacterium]
MTIESPVVCDGQVPAVVRGRPWIKRMLTGEVLETSHSRQVTEVVEGLRGVN